MLRTVVCVLVSNGTGASPAGGAEATTRSTAEAPSVTAWRASRSGGGGALGVPFSRSDATNPARVAWTSRS